MLIFPPHYSPAISHVEIIWDFSSWLLEIFVYLTYIILFISLCLNMLYSILYVIYYLYNRYYIFLYYNYIYYICYDSYDTVYILLLFILLSLFIIAFLDRTLRLIFVCFSLSFIFFAEIKLSHSLRENLLVQNVLIPCMFKNVFILIHSWMTICWT